MIEIKKTKIVATLGPATNTEEKIKELAFAGANMFRINTSHGKLEEHETSINLIKKVAEETKKYLPVLIDLQGPKIRIGTLLEPTELKENEEIILMPSKEQVSKD